MSIHQEVIIKAPAAGVYAVLTDADRFAKMTGGRKAQIDAREGGKVSLFGGDIQAQNVELVPGRRVVQAWRAGNWPAGVYSIVRFELSEKDGATALVFDQAGQPADAGEMLEGGWHQMYWQPMKALLG